MGQRHPLRARRLGLDPRHRPRASGSRTRSGSARVWINNHITMASEMPHGGFKQSGYGKDMSAYSVEDYTIVKHVMINLE